MTDRMDRMTTDFERYWDGTLEELASYPAKPEVELTADSVRGFRHDVQRATDEHRAIQAVWVPEHTAGHRVVSDDLLSAEIPERA